MCAATGLETLATDKADYLPEETVQLTGTGFAASCGVLVKVTRPDGSVVVGDGSFTPGSDTVMTDELGSLAYGYVLDGIDGQYLVEAIGADGVVLVETTFTDALAITIYHDSLYADPGFIFARGDTIYARATMSSPDNGRYYRGLFYKPGNATPIVAQACTAGTTSFTFSYTTLSTDPLSLPGQLQAYTTIPDSQVWTAVIERYDTSSCATLISRVATKFRLLQLTPQPLQELFYLSTATVTVSGLRGSVALNDAWWVKPDGTTCPITPDPVPPASGALTLTYPGGGCTWGGTGNAGTWKLRLNFEDILDIPAFFVADPQIAIAKVTVDGSTTGDDLSILTGESIKWRYTVTNVGNVPLSSISVTDSEAGVTPVYVSGDTSNIGKLDLTETWIYEASGTAITGDYDNTGSASGSYTNTAGTTTTDTATDDSAYFGADPKIDIVKKTVGADGTEGDGVFVFVGDTVTWKYYVTNTGNVALSNVVVKDNNGTPGNTADDITVCTLPSLAVGGTSTCTTTGTAAAGNYSNTGTASGSYTDSGGHSRTATDSDTSSYFGLPNGAVTSSSLCEFDVSSDPGKQFRLIFTPEMTSASYKLNASNPGQFYYNAFFVADGDESITIDVPYPFVTQGATPIHVYDGLTATYAGGKFCFTPGTEIYSETDQVVLGGSYDGFGDFATIEVGPFTHTGLVYVAVHLDYGLKKTLPYSKNATTLQAYGYATIDNAEPYGFSDSKSGDDTVQSLNEFKKDPGIGGLVLRSGSGDPVAGATVEIWLGTKKQATVTTDADGWYMWNYKYTGKAATFTVKVPASGLSQTATLKSNGFLVVNFTTP